MHIVWVSCILSGYHAYCLGNYRKAKSRPKAISPNSAPPSPPPASCWKCSLAKTSSPSPPTTSATPSAPPITSTNPCWKTPPAATRSLSPRHLRGDGCVHAFRGNLYEPSKTVTDAQKPEHGSKRCAMHIVWEIIERGIFHRPAVLSPEAALLCGDRAEGRKVQTGAPRAIELLPHGGGCADQVPARRCHHRPAPV